MRKYLTAEITGDTQKQSNLELSIEHKPGNMLLSVLQIKHVTNKQNSNFYKSHIHIVYPEQTDRSIFIIRISICKTLW